MIAKDFENMSQEVEILEATFGAFLEVEHEVPMSAKQYRYWKKKTPKRRAEILVVAQRPTGEVLVHTKHKYPPGVYRLPTGGIKRNELAHSALHREVQEETGFLVQNEQFLGLIHYRFQHLREAPIPFTSYVFLVPDLEGEPVSGDPDEGILDFRWTAPENLPQIADQLRQLSNDIPGRSDWGQFRALAHDFVAQTIESRSSIA